MRHHNTLLHGLLQFLPWSRFDALVDEHGSDRRVRKLSSKSQLIALIHAQLSGASSLREVEATMASQQVRLYHLGASAPKALHAGRRQQAAASRGVLPAV